MSFRRWLVAALTVAVGVVCFGAVVLVRSQEKHGAKPSAAGQITEKANREKALRLNTLGVAYLNQQRPGEIGRAHV